MWKLKEEKLKIYEEAKKRKEVDEDLLELLDLINSFPNYVTLSSCSGRVAVLDLENFGEKFSAKFLGKWHSFVSFEEVLNSAKRSERVAWLIQYPPIIHVACKTLKDAKNLLEIANNSGFRRSGIISLKNFVVEIASFERIELPIAFKGKILVDENYLNFIIDLANRKLERGKEKLKRLYSKLSQVVNSY
ncbi:MAG: hypothetical protein NZ895_00305 [Archaeoglobaceae archaeon]|nr:hypothetical protein [Archaeoglobaceae archaeon]MCX8152319.1 hypothetical protein [Archaeoglobaceae archaeon]MDW8013653.1 hypothetical protein [Archaeoglobaceae archaeon]